MAHPDAVSRLTAAKKLLLEDTVGSEKIDAFRRLVAGIDSRLDNQLKKVSGVVKDIEHISSGEYIDLTVKHLPNKTKQDKKRKKLLLLLLKHWNQLEQEIDRVSGETAGQTSSTQQALNILSKAKGPLGLTTLIAIGVVLVLNNKSASSQSSQQSPSPQTPTIEVAVIKGRQVPLNTLHIGNGPECSGEHYHAQNGQTVATLDGAELSDPGGCGFGLVSQTEVISVPAPHY